MKTVLWQAEMKIAVQYDDQYVPVFVLLCNPPWRAEKLLTVGVQAAESCQPSGKNGNCLKHKGKIGESNYFANRWLQRGIIIKVWHAKYGKSLFKYLSTNLN